MERNAIHNIETQFDNILFLVEERPFKNYENGDISMLKTDNTRFFFETNKINQISPSFLSRINMIYIHEDTLSCFDLFKNYLVEKCINVWSVNKETLLNLYKMIFMPFVKFCINDLRNV